MKHSENNEMDLLLRGLAKRSSSVSNGGDGAPQAAAHLDADELNAFAERTIPPAARARYTAHLADCTRCRKLVATLSAAAGLPIAEIKTEEPEKVSFWQRLPAFLSPAVLRFAVPALAMLAVITVGIITFRQQRSADFVAQNQEPATPQSVSKPQQEPTGATTGATTSETQSAARQPSPVPAPNSTPVAAKPTTPGEESVAKDKVTSVDSPSGYLAKDAAKPEATKADEAQPKFAPEPPAPAPATAAARPQAGASVGAANKNEAVAKQKEGAAGDTGERQTRDERQVAEDREVDASRSRKAAAAGRGGALSASEVRRSETEQKRADQDAEVREVAGRRFRKQGNAWIDVAYVANRPAINIVRGSEQYRVLVADEPTIRTIAEKLAGEVIVVWKGRAYRIR